MLLHHHSFANSVQSLTIVDSEFLNVDEVIRLPRGDKFRPAIFIDNLKGSGVKSTVKEDEGASLLTGGNVDQWGLGWRFTDEYPNGIATYGPVSPSPKKPATLLTSGNFFERSKPQYSDRSKGDYLNVLHFGAKNEGKSASASENTKSINNAMRAAAGTGKVLLFPAGIYPVDDTIHIPAGTRIQGALWSQIMAVGSAFGDPEKPKVLAQ
jgi:glucan 1,3-beta-glucosidase